MNFGYTTKGGNTLATGKFFASRFICPDAGILNSVSVYLKNASGSAQNIQIGIFNDAAGAVGTALIYSATLSLPIGFDDWRTVALSGNLLLGGAYWLTVQLENSASIVYVYYDAGGTDQGAFKEAWTFGNWADNPAGLTYSTNKISISASYTYVNPNSFSWFQMPKSQIDPERMEEAIARLILEHEQDEESHLGAGESLQSHKASEIIDHVVDSIVADKIKMGEVDLNKLSADKMLYLSHFESIDGWTISSGATTLLGFGLFLATTATAHTAMITSKLLAGDIFVDVSKNLFMQTSIRVISTTDQIIYFYFGGGKFGFKIVNNTLYACHYKSPTEYTTEITGITLTDIHVYRAEYDYLAAEIRFYVDGVIKATHTTNLPVDASNEDVFCFSIWTSTATPRGFMIYDLLLTRDR